MSINPNLIEKQLANPNPADIAHVLNTLQEHGINPYFLEATNLIASKWSDYEHLNNYLKAHDGIAEFAPQKD